MTEKTRKLEKTEKLQKLKKKLSNWKRVIFFDFLIKSKRFRGEKWKGC